MNTYIISHRNPGEIAVFWTDAGWFHDVQRATVFRGVAATKACIASTTILGTPIRLRRVNSRQLFPAQRLEFASAA